MAVPTCVFIPGLMRAGGEEGPRFQALPEPAPLPPLPRPTQPEAAMSPAGAPAGSATVLQVSNLMSVNIPGLLPAYIG